MFLCFIQGLIFGSLEISRAMAKNINFRTISKLNLSGSSFAKSIKGIPSHSAEKREIYSALVVLRAIRDFNLEAHRIGQLA